MKTYKNIHDYIKSVPADLLPKVKEMYLLVKKLIPKGGECINYGMPTIQINGKNVIHFAAMRGHLGFYPAPSGVRAFENELSAHGISFSKGCIRFSYAKPLPVSLITKIIKFRLQEEKNK